MAKNRKPKVQASSFSKTMRRIAREGELADLREGRKQRAVTFVDRSKVDEPFRVKGGGRARSYDD